MTISFRDMQEEVQLWDEVMNAVFESSSDESDRFASSSESSSEEEEEDIQIVSAAIVAREPGMPLPRVSNFVERIIPNIFSAVFQGELSVRAIIYQIMKA